MPPRPSSTLQVNGRKRHAMVDTDGRGLKLQVHPASIQDRDGAIPLLRASRAWYPFIERVFADSAYVAERVANATRIIIEIVRKPPGQIGFAVHPRRWWSSASWHGSGATGVWQRISMQRSPPQPHSSMPLQLCSSHDDWLVRLEIRVGL